MFIFTLNKVNGETLRDPTQPSFLTNLFSLQNTPFALTAIFFEKNRRLAVINGKILSEGAEINGSKVILIHSNSVNLKGPSGNITLFLFKQASKTDSNH